jgi:hypothetical protein
MHRANRTDIARDRASARDERSRRARTRGAVLVESIVVISALTLGLTGIVFFRDSYQKRLSVLRLARASAIAHSMAGCQANQAGAWLGPDVGQFQTSEPQQERESAPGPKSQPATNGGANDDGRSQRLLNKSGGTTSDGEGLLNPIASTDFAGHSRVSAGDGVRGGKHTTFEAHPKSRSFVTCGDEVKDGDYNKVLEMIKEEAQALFNTR